MKWKIPLTMIIFFIFNYLNVGYAQNKHNAFPEIITIPSIIGEINLLHGKHFKEYGVECKSCHHEIYAPKLNIPHGEYSRHIWKGCNYCHTGDKNQKVDYKCGNCHKILTTNFAEETQSSKVVIHKNCSLCHDMGKEKKAAANCKFCHSGPKKKLIPNY